MDKRILTVSSEYGGEQLVGSSEMVGALQQGLRHRGSHAGDQ